MKIENWKEIGFVSLHFSEHVRNHLNYPEIQQGDNQFNVVPIKFLIDKNGTLSNIEYSKTPTALSSQYKYTTKQVFINEAIKVIESFKEWVPNKVEGEYQETKKYLNISFFYHDSVLIDDEICLNPDSRVRYLNKAAKYERTVQGKNGCDGIGTVLSIIDEQGMPKNIKCLQALGKTNCDIVKSEFLKLGKWEPAILNGKNVKSQLLLAIYT